jgi:acetyltransferase EpsM
VLPDAVLDAAVSIGDFCSINLNATISHNLTVSSFWHAAINAEIAGGFVLGEGSFVAASSVALSNIKIGKWTIIGTGAVVTKDVSDYAVVYGNPARIIKYTNERD